MKTAEEGHRKYSGKEKLKQKETKGQTLLTETMQLNIFRKQVVLRQRKSQMLRHMKTNIVMQQLKMHRKEVLNLRKWLQNLRKR